MIIIPIAASTQLKQTEFCISFRCFDNKIHDFWIITNTKPLLWTSIDVNDLKSSMSKVCVYTKNICFRCLHLHVFHCDIVYEYVFAWKREKNVSFSLPLSPTWFTQFWNQIKTAKKKQHVQKANQVNEFTMKTLVLRDSWKLFVLAYVCLKMLSWFLIRDTVRVR